MISHIWKNRNEYCVDTAADLNAWDVSGVDMGARAYVIETGKRMILNGSKKWKEYGVADGGSGGGDDSGLPDISGDDNGKILMVVNGQWTVVDDVAVVGEDEKPETSFNLYGIKNNLADIVQITGDYDLGLAHTDYLVASYGTINPEDPSTTLPITSCTSSNTSVCSASTFEAFDIKAAEIRGLEAGEAQVTVTIEDGSSFTFDVVVAVDCSDYIVCVSSANNRRQPETPIGDQLTINISDGDVNIIGSPRVIATDVCWHISSITSSDTSIVSVSTFTEHGTTGATLSPLGTGTATITVGLEDVPCEYTFNVIVEGANT